MNGKNHHEDQIAQLERRIRRLEYTQRTLDLDLRALENSLLFRVLRRAGRPFLEARMRVATWLAGSRFERLWWRAVPPDLSQSGSNQYSSWIEHQESGAAPALTSSPRFGILLAVGNASEWMREAVASVLAQTYPHWQLRVCLEDSSSSREFLSTHVDSDPRIRVFPVPAGSSISETLNQAAQSTAAEYLLVFDHAGRLAPHALQWLADAVPADLIYSDEDHVDEAGHRADPVFKPGWSPDLLLSCMYMGRVTVVSRPAWELAGRFREGFEAVRDHDLALRITDQEAKVTHVARVLYHGRRIPAGVGSVSVPEVARVAGARAIREALSRRHAAAEVEDGFQPGVYQLRWRPRGNPRVSLVICSRSAGLLDRCLRGVQASSYSNREIVVVHHLDPDDQSPNEARVRAVIDRHGVRRVPYSGPFHFSVMNNLGADAATGDVLVFLNDDTEPLDASWLDRLVGQVQRPGVGVAGAQLVYPSGTLQHAGVAIGVNGGCGHIGRRAITPAHWPWLRMTRDVAAVTGACLAIDAALFRKLGGFAAEFPVNYNDIDLCLRARASGHRVVCDTSVVLRHYECQTRQRGVVTLGERETWFDRWGDLMEAGDPFYSPHLTRDREDLSLRDEPLRAVSGS